MSFIWWVDASAVLLLAVMVGVSVWLDRRDRRKARTGTRPDVRRSQGTNDMGGRRAA